jgi:hypothetical protein
MKACDRVWCNGADQDVVRDRYERRRDYIVAAPTIITFQLIPLVRDQYS